MRILGILTLISAAFFCLFFFGDRTNANILLVVGISAFLCFAWYLRATSCLLAGYLFLSGWNYGNGLALTNFVIDGFLVIGIIMQILERELRSWYRSIRWPFGIIMVCLLLLMAAGKLQSLTMLHLQLQGFLFGIFCSLLMEPLEKVLTISLELLGVILSAYCISEVIYTGISRAEGPNGSATAFGVALAMVFSYLFPVFVCKITSQIWLGSIVLASLFCAVILSGTRSAFLACLISIFITTIIIAIRWKDKLKIVALFSGIALLGSFIWMVIPSHFVLKQNLSAVSGGQIDMSSLGRLIAWKFAWIFFLQHPIFGIGMGQFCHRIPDLPIFGKFQHAHSLYLNTLAEMGLVGEAALFVLILTGLRRAWINLSNSNNRVVSAGLFCFAISTIFMGFFDTVPYYPSLLGIAWLLYGSCMRLPAIVNPKASNI